MRRNLTGNEKPEERPRFCPNCGAANTTFGLRCTNCGHLYADKPPIESYWDRPNPPSVPISEYSGEDASPPPDSDEDQSDTAAAAMATRPYTPVLDPWSSMGGRLGAEPGASDAFVPPVSSPDARREGGPPAWFLGLVGILLIGVVGFAALALVIRPVVSDRVGSAASDAISISLAHATVVPDVSSGTVVVTEQEISQAIRANRDELQPLKNLRVQIRRTGIEATFSVYGVPGTLTGSVKVQKGKIVIVDPKLTGAVGRMIEVDRIAHEAEQAINDLLARNNLRATAVTLSDDTMTISTAPRT
jgi:hypothetical protein